MSSAMKILLTFVVFADRSISAIREISLPPEVPRMLRKTHPPSHEFLSAQNRAGKGRVLARIVLCICGLFVMVQAQQPNTEALRYRYIGPVGNRVTSIAGIPGQPYIYYAGSASGGIFKTIDGGIHWDAIFDGQPVSSIGSLAVAPSDPNILWAGTGEAWIRSHISVGQGIYKSTDAGKTWKLMGLEKTGRIGHLAIDPKNPDIVLACAV